MSDPGRSDNLSGAAGPDDAVRAGLAQVADRIPLPPGSHGGPCDAYLVAAVHRRAARISLRRTATRGALVAGSVVAVIATVTGIGSLMEPGSSPGPATAPAASAAVMPAPSGASPTVVIPAPPNWGKPAWEDDFGGSSLDRDRWNLLYNGGKNTRYSDWAASDTGVSGGALHLAVTRTGGTTPAATSGGIGSTGSGTANGRWEVRWRMTSGQGVIGQLVLMETVDSAQKPRYLLTLQPAANRLSIEDTETAQVKTVDIDAGQFHSAAVELTPSAVLLRVDGKVAANWPEDRSKAIPLWPALQTLLAGPDCGATPLLADCGGRATSFPQRLDVDRIRYFAAP
jgi:hypothetical protein